MRGPVVHRLSRRRCSLPLARQLSRGCLRPSTITGTPGRSGSANELETEAAENARKRFGIIVPCHDGSGWDVPRIKAGEKKELSVP